EIAATVEDDRLDTGLLSGCGEQLADLGRLLGLRALEGLFQLPVARGGNGLALGVVHELGRDAAVRAEHDEARSLGGAEDLVAHALVAAQPRFSDGQRGHSITPASRLCGARTRPRNGCPCP